MNLRQVRKLANKLMKEHVGDYHLCWTDKKKQIAGALRTPAGENILYISRRIARKNPPEVMYDIILHEIAHFLTWKQEPNGHGNLWLKKFLELGGSGRVKYKVIV